LALLGAYLPPVARGVPIPPIVGSPGSSTLLPNSTHLFFSHPCPPYPYTPPPLQFPPVPVVPAIMSRSDRIVNILLALAWVLLIVRVGRIYFESTSGGGGGAVASSEYADEPIPSPIVLVSVFRATRAHGVAQRKYFPPHSPFHFTPHTNPSNFPAPPLPPFLPPAHAHLHHWAPGAEAHCGQVPLLFGHGWLSKV
jgi:hypothetical protein